MNLPKVGEEIKVTFTLKVMGTDTSDSPIQCAFVDFGVDRDGDYETYRWYSIKEWNIIQCLADPEYKRKQLTAQIEELQKTLAELDDVKGESNE